MKLNDEQLRPQLIKILKMVTKKKEGEHVIPYDLHKSVIFFRLMTGILATIKDFFVPSYSVYFDFQLELLAGLNSVFTS
jgi:hypothetical protein